MHRCRAVKVPFTARFVFGQQDRALRACPQREAGPLGHAKGPLWCKFERKNEAEMKTAELGYANVDLDRKARTGAPEVIYGAGKNAEEIVGIARTIFEAGQEPVLITRLDEEKAAFCGQAFGDAFRYYKDARIGLLGAMPRTDGVGKIVVLTGGTSDIPVAEEAALTAEAMGNEVVRHYDVGVAGLHRLLACTDDIQAASVIIAVAGMEGALASVVAGLAPAPVLAVPTSVGYGASFGGLSALLSMLNSCASGVSVVNIDNGFGAGFQASLINHVGKKQ